MATPDLLFGFLISRFLSRPEARSPAVVFPSGGNGPTPPSSPPATTTPAPSSPAAPTVPASLPAPSFPAQVPVPPATQPQQQQAPAGFKRAIEIWQVNPTLIRQAGTALVGAPPEVIGAAAAITLQALEARFPSGWVSLRRAPTAAEAQQAKALLAKWRDGGVVFMGPATLQGRLAYRMTKHPAGPAATPTAPLPSSATFPPAPATPAPAAPTVPAAAPRPVETLPEVLVTADAPKPAPGPSTPAPSGTVTQITAVRRGEGLAQVAKRLGRPATQQSALELRAANVPGPDGHFSSQDLSKGGLKKAGRAGGLQPGDRLFVPPSWGVVDAARL